MRTFWRQQMVRALGLCALAACSSRQTTDPSAAPGSPAPPPAGSLEAGAADAALGQAPQFQDGGSAPLPPPPPATCVQDPANYDVPDNHCDDDGDGKIDNTPVCDEALLTSADANDMARALGLCQTASGPNDKTWGVIAAAYGNGFGSTDPPASGQHGVLPAFGNVIVPREGQSLAVLSTGWARLHDGASGQDPFKDNQIPMQPGPGGAPIANAGGGPPAGFPQPSTGCPALGHLTTI